MKGIKKNDIAIWGAGTDEGGRVTAFRRGGFYVRYRSIYPSVPGGRKPVFKRAFFRREQVVECLGFPPKGRVKIHSAMEA